MNLIEFINQLSFKKVVGLSIVIVLILAVPITVWVAQQETHLPGEAYFQKPQPIIPERKYGAPPEGQPQITLVWPFLGKEGDAVLIEGNNFGDNPINKQLKVGEVLVDEREINKWTPNLIEFLIPPGAKEGPISIMVAGKKAQWDFPFTVYDIYTPTQVTEKDHLIKVINGPAEGKIIIYLNDGQILESKEFSGFVYPPDKTIISVKILDKNGNSIPFFVEPTEFGF